MAARPKQMNVPAREPRVPRTYRLPLSKVKAAKRALGAATATDTIEQALDLVVFQRQLIDGTRSMLGVVIAATTVASPAKQRRQSQIQDRSR